MKEPLILSLVVRPNGGCCHLQHYVDEVSNNPKQIDIFISNTIIWRTEQIYLAVVNPSDAPIWHLPFCTLYFSIPFFSITYVKFRMPEEEKKEEGLEKVMKSEGEEKKKEEEKVDPKDAKIRALDDADVAFLKSYVSACHNTPIFRS